MIFTIKNDHFMSIDNLRTNALLTAYYVIKNYSFHASELVLDKYIKQQYKVSLKDMCIKLLLSLTFYKNNDGDLVLLFKDTKYDKIAQLITYGNGIIRGSQILSIALNS